MDYRKRISQLQERMDEEDVSAVVLSPGPSMSYIGLPLDEGAPALVFVRKYKLPLIAAHETYEGRIDLEYETDAFYEDFEDAVESVSAEVQEGEVLLDDTMQEKQSQVVRKALGEREFGLSGELLGPMRKVKDEEEVKAIRKASSITDDVVEKVRDLGEEAVGMTELELASKIDLWIREEGGGENAFPTIVASGQNAAEIHHEPEKKRIREGEPVVLDFGTTKKRYSSDQTRTVVFGDASDKFREVFEIVRRAQEEGLESVAPGVSASEIHEAVMEVIDSEGYGKDFTHSTGHGVGLEVHEPPRIGESSEDELEKGMVVTVEPGIYLQGEFGVRIEDTVIVTEDGCESLNTTPKQWKL